MPNLRCQRLPLPICALIFSLGFITQALAAVSPFHDFLREFPTAYAIQGPSVGEGGDEQRFTRVYEELVSRLKLPPELSTQAIREQVEKLSRDEKAPLIDRARADFVRRQYQQVEELAIQAGDVAHRAKSRKPTDISLALQLAALAALERGQNDSALKYIQVAQGETDPKKDLLAWAQIQTSLAHIHWRSSRPAEQISTLRLILSEYMQTEGVTNPYTLYYHNELAAALYDDRQDAAAEKELREILRITETNFGADDAKTVSVRKNLARILESQEHFEDAEAFRRAVIDVQKRTLGVDNPVTLRSRDQLVKNLFEQRKFSECEAEAIGLLELSQRVLGVDHLVTLACQLKLAQCQREQGMMAEAEAKLRVLQEKEIKALGADHLETLNTAQDLGVCLNAQRKYDEAVKVLKPVLGARIRLLKSDHRDTLDTRSQLGIAYQNTGLLEEAEIEFRAVLTALTSQLGKQHPKTVLATQRVSDLLNSPEAKALMISNAKSQLTTAIKAFGPNDTRTLNTQLSLAGTLLNQGQLPEAEKEYRLVHASLTRLLKEETPESLKILREVANSLLNQNKWAEAEPIFIQVLRDQRRVLKPTDPEILQTLYLTGICLGQQNKINEARPILEECLAGTSNVPNILPAFVEKVKNVLDQIIQIQRQPKSDNKVATPATTSSPAPSAASLPADQNASGPQTINKPLPFKP
ncbi:MAG: tetratricopeptide repeat protein [Prosthecobacter sp.]